MTTILWALGGQPLFSPRTGNYVAALMRRAIVESWWRAGSGGSCLRLRFDDLNSVVELYSQDDFGQEAVAFETAPALFGSLRELEDHRQRSLVGETPLRSGRAMADGSKRSLDRV